MKRLIQILLCLLAGPALAGELQIDALAGYSATRHLGFEDEIAPVLGLDVEWSPDNRWSLDAMWTVRYADKRGDADSVQTTLLLRGCWTTRRDAGLRLCAGDWSSSLVTGEWEKVGGGAMASIGWVWRWQDVAGDRFWIELDAAHSPNSNTAPEVSGTTLTLRLQGERWGLHTWATLVEPVDGSLPRDGVESAVLLVRRWR